MNNVLDDHPTSNDDFEVVLEGLAWVGHPLVPSDMCRIATAGRAALARLRQQAQEREGENERAERAEKLADMRLRELREVRTALASYGVEDKTKPDEDFHGMVTVFALVHELGKQRNSALAECDRTKMRRK